MRLLFLLFFIFSLTSCSAVVRSPVPITDETTVGIISFVGATAKNRTWGISVLGNSDLSKPVDWDINRYLTSGIRGKVESLGMNAIEITDPNDIQALEGATLDGFSRLRPEVISAMDLLEEKYDVDIIILAKEYNRSEPTSALFTEGYGITKYPNETFIHTNITLYSIEIAYRNMFLPASLDGYAFQPFARRINDSRANLIDKDSETVMLDSETKGKVEQNIDELIDWYFRDYPVMRIN